jgi:hypothetical protein
LNTLHLLHAKTFFLTIPQAGSDSSPHFPLALYILTFLFPAKHRIKIPPNAQFVVKIFAHIKKIQYLCGVMTKKRKNTYFRQ